MMDLEKRNIAVIGCGLSGINAIKACLEEGLNPVCFEQHDQIGMVNLFRSRQRRETF